jgi:hypothetical protein
MTVGGASLGQIAADFGVEYHDAAPEMGGFESPPLEFQAKKGNRDAEAPGELIYGPAEFWGGVGP